MAGGGVTAVTGDGEVDLVGIDGLENVEGDTPGAVQTAIPS